MKKQKQHTSHQFENQLISGLFNRNIAHYFYKLIIFIQYHFCWMSESDFHKADLAMQELLKQQNIATKANREQSISHLSPNGSANNLHINSQAISEIPLYSNQVIPPTSYIQNHSTTINQEGAPSPILLRQQNIASAANIFSPSNTNNQGYAHILPPNQVIRQPLVKPEGRQVIQSRMMDVPIKPEVTAISPPKPLLQQFKSTSKVQYIPFNRKIIEYKQQKVVKKVPKTKKIVQYKQQVVSKMVPREVVKKDYYAIEHLKQYVPQYVPEKVTHMVQKAVPFKRIEYIPVTRQVYHGVPLDSQATQNANFQINNIPAQPVGNYWQNNVQNFNEHGFSPLVYQQGNYSGLNCTDYMKTKFSNIYDDYQSYVPSFKY